MRIHLATDHAGFEVKNAVAAHLRGLGHEVVDHGAHVFDALDDYPPFCFEAATAVAEDSQSLGFVFGGSGNGEQIAANKVTGIRAALLWSTQIAQLAREHNDANVGAIGARQHPLADVLAMVETFVATPFSGNERHVRRIGMLDEYEAGR